MKSAVSQITNRFICAWKILCASGEKEESRKRIEQTAEKQIVDSIKEDISERIFRKGRWDETQLQAWVKDIVVEAVLEHKDDIIREAASQLCEYMKRTKAVKQAVAETVASEMEAEGE